ncbi:MAG: sodium:proton antiporter [Planctomycetes bacterium]|nr:sodium:proton antiporter [Planctomycetota bacterium]
MVVLLISGAFAQTVEPAPHAASAEAHPESGGHHAPDINIWWITPFVLMLLCIAILPLMFHHWWESNLNKGIISFVLGLPAVIYVLNVYPPELLVVLQDYISFIILLGSLFIIAGGIYIKGSLAGSPLTNTVVLAIGAVLASFIGTTGAAMLLIRPLIRANKARKDKAHVIIFFIFIVANCGGLLTPLGDPPLFLGFLKGVPFLWTFRLWMEWLFVNGILLIVFNFIDQWKFRREDIATPGDLDKQVEPKKPLAIEGGINFLLLLGIVATIFLSGDPLGGEEKHPWEFGVKEGFMVFLAILSMVMTKKHTRKENGFTFAPIIEVAVLFIGIFATMVPALILLNANGKSLGLTEPWHFFWATGSLSSFLDNAPTYLTMAATASGIMNVPLEGSYLAEFLKAGQSSIVLLTAISCGAVFMGANTYIGNGPNFMVKAIAEESHIKMPSFFGYMAYSVLILIPIFILTTFVFFR